MLKKLPASSDPFSLSYFCSNFREYPKATTVTVAKSVMKISGGILNV